MQVAQITTEANSAIFFFALIESSPVLMRAFGKNRNIRASEDRKYIVVSEDGGAEFRFTVWDIEQLGSLTYTPISPDDPGAEARFNDIFYQLSLLFTGCCGSSPVTVSGGSFIYKNNSALGQGEFLFSSGTLVMSPLTGAVQNLIGMYSDFPDGSRIYMNSPESAKFVIFEVSNYAEVSGMITFAASVVSGDPMTFINGDSFFTYFDKSVPPAPIPNLQQVTDVGNTTTNSLLVNNNNIEVTGTDKYVSVIDPENGNSGVKIGPVAGTGGVLQLVNEGGFIGSIKADLLENSSGYRLPTASGTFITRVCDVTAQVTGNILASELKTALGYTYDDAFNNAPQDSVSTGVTAYHNPYGGSTTDSNEAARQGVIQVAGTVKHLFVHLSTATGSSGGASSFVVTMRKNGASQALTVAIPASSSVGVFSDTDPSHNFSVSPGDLLSVQVVNSSGSSVTIASYGWLLERVL